MRVKNASETFKDVEDSDVSAQGCMLVSQVRLTLEYQPIHGPVKGI